MLAMVSKYLCIQVLVLQAQVGSIAFGFSPLDDDIFYNINWHKHGTKLADLDVPVGQVLNPANSYQMKTVNKESYTCTLPSEEVVEENLDTDGAHSRGSEMDAEKHAPHVLLAPLFAAENCAYRVESYWTYEVCHAHHVRQYHEERIRSTPGSSQTTHVKMTTENGGRMTIEPSSEANTLIKTTEFFLGNFQGNVDKSGALKNPPAFPKTPADVPMRKIDGVSRPYYAMEMTRGTACDLKPGSFRKTTVIYVCASAAYNEVASVRETATCEYEIIVFTPHLCANKLYRVASKDANKIQCIADEGSPPQPSLLAPRQDPTLYFANHQQMLNRVLQQAMVIGDSMGVDENGQSVSKIKISLKKANPTEQGQVLGAQQKQIKEQRVKESKVMNKIDKSGQREFITGDRCVHGGVGWWRFEFCHGRHVNQYHDDAKQGRTTINLGNWDRAAHLEWAAKPTKTTQRALIYAAANSDGTKTLRGVQQLYTGGDYCEEAKTARQVIVRLLCVRNASSPDAVTIYMREPQTCSYHLTLESNIICDLLADADENGILHHKND